jgi:hypothetical protein
MHASNILDTIMNPLTNTLQKTRKKNDSITTFNNSITIFT